jgi:predicted PurR-regulated permease PerM
VVETGFGRTLLVVAAAVIVIVGLRLAADTLAPFVIGGFVALLVLPLHDVLVRRGWSRALAVTAGTAAYLGVLLIVALIAMQTFAELRTVLPAVQAAIEEARADAEQSFGEVLGQAISSFLDALRDAASFPTGGALLGIAIGLGISALVVVYALADAPGLRSRAERTAPASFLAGWTHFAKEIQLYFGARAVLGLVFALGVGVVLLLIGVDLVLLWVLVAFFFSFIPNIGFMFSVLGPTLLALVSLGLGPALLVIAGYTGVNVITDYVIQPRYMSRELDLSPLVVFVSLFIWAAILGPVGAILALPLTVGVKILFDAFPATRSLGALLGAEG